LIVRQSPQNFEYPTKLSDTKNISTWCFFSKGTATLNVSYLKNHFSPDESMQVVCELNNTRCTIDASSISLQLFQAITLRAGAETKYLNRKIAETRYSGNYPAGQESARTLDLNMTDNNNPTLRHLEKCEHRYMFKDLNQVAKLQCTTKSQLVECRYFLIATVDYDSCLCCSGKPTIEIPIIIYMPDLFNSISMLKPQDWNPVVMPTCQFDLPSAENLGLNAGYSVNVKIENDNYNNNNNFNQNNFNSSPQMIVESYQPINNQENTDITVVTTNYQSNNNVVTRPQHNFNSDTNVNFNMTLDNNGGMYNTGSHPHHNNHYQNNHHNEHHHTNHHGNHQGHHHHHSNHNSDTEIKVNFKIDN